MRIQIPISTDCELWADEPFNVAQENGEFIYWQTKRCVLTARSKGYSVTVTSGVLEPEMEPKSLGWKFSQVQLTETNDGIPIEVPLTTPETLQETIARMVRIGLEKQEEIDADAETFEESLDFDVDEDPDPVSQYELTEMQEESPVEAMLNEAKEPNDDIRAEDSGTSGLGSSGQGDVERAEPDMGREDAGPSIGKQSSADSRRAGSGSGSLNSAPRG